MYNAATCPSQRGASFRDVRALLFDCFDPERISKMRSEMGSGGNPGAFSWFVLCRATKNEHKFLQKTIYCLFLGARQEIGINNKANRTIIQLVLI